MYIGDTYVYTLDTYMHQLIHWNTGCSLKGNGVYESLLWTTTAGEGQLYWVTFPDGYKGDTCTCTCRVSKCT